MKILDSHVHIFNRKIIDNTISKTELISKLFLKINDIYNRLNTRALLTDMRSADVSAALVLPTSSADKLSETNRLFVKLVSQIPELFTAGTLHPSYINNSEELSYLSCAGVRIIKLCSFSQGFALDYPKTYAMFQLIQDFNKNSERPFAVVLDTFTQADRYFRTDPKNNPSPQLF